MRENRAQSMPGVCVEGGWARKLCSFRAKANVNRTCLCNDPALPTSQGMMRTCPVVQRRITPAAHLAHNHLVPRLQARPASQARSTVAQLHPQVCEHLNQQNTTNSINAPWRLSKHLQTDAGVGQGTPAKTCLWPKQTASVRDSCHCRDCPIVVQAPHKQRV
jgi:hypothetical protein